MKNKIEIKNEEIETTNLANEEEIETTKNDEKKYIQIIKKQWKEKLLTKKQNARILFLIFLAAFIVLSIIWIYINTGNVTLEQLIFHLKVPIEGTNIGMIFDYLGWTFLGIIGIILISNPIIFLYEIYSNKTQESKKKILYRCSNIILALSIMFVIILMDLPTFAKNQILASTFIEEYYVDPSQVNVTFPKEKQNLIYIYLESVENTFASKKDGGLYDTDKMPELTKLAKENINFSNTEKLGGALNLLGTNWTIAAMVAQTSGVPLKISIEQNSYGRHSTFLPGTYTLGEMLEKNGYKNYLLLGSESEFGGRKLYFEQHGNYEIWDFNSAVEEQRMKEEDKVWWGYSDQDLFKYAKEQLLEISKKDKPFNFTMLTADTHFTDGYVCSNCQKDFKDQYSNVIKCSSKQVSEFVEWIKKQDFFENTTVIVTGDHLTMQASIEEDADKNNYGERSVYNTIINSKVQPNKTTNRLFFTTDMYPTTLASLGAQIEGDRLGLGTNLFSEEPTIIEKFGLDYVREQLERKSAFYNKKIIYGEQ